MREILFRGKRIDNGEWVEGLVARFHVGTGKVLTTGYVPPELKLHIQYACDNRYLTAAEVDPATVGQYTGKEDINHHKAFENDRIMYKGEYHTVYGFIRFGNIPPNGSVETHTGFYIEWEDDGENKWSDWWRCDLGYWLNCPECAIIGAIHDKEG